MAAEQPAGMLTEVEMADIGDRYGPTAEARVRHWQEMIRRFGTLSDEDRLKQVNDFFNGARFLSDPEVWQREDYWATPLEFLIVDAGDCEDFSIAKYFTLEEMGVPAEKMRLTFVKALTLNKAHMVLAYYPQPNGVPLILDNLNPAILPASERVDLQPVYSFNGEELWLAKTRRQQVKAGDADSLQSWRELKARVAAGVPATAMPLPRGP